MGSGSSKSKRRVINVCSQQPLRPTEIPKGESAIEGRVGCKQNQTVEWRTAKATQPVLEIKGSRYFPNDPDLQLLDDILTESEDCLSWPEPICKGQKMTTSSHTTCDPESLSPHQENKNKDKRVPIMLQITPELQPESSKSKETQHREQHKEDSKTAPGTRRVLDLENNNLPIHLPTCPDHVEKPPRIAYDETEEALMDSIEQEYTQLHPIPPMCCGKM
ncbi:uncharacterized protein ACNLHF_011752 [Anomaloglossus baeobatrachus]|uniref:uncharacterized protein LOC142296949 n=1 Tax=Anomaloglossus baeobatrachus TaxID=238106 RepID=UPI003F4FC911